MPLVILQSFQHQGQDIIDAQMISKLELQAPGRDYMRSSQLWNDRLKGDRISFEYVSIC